MTEGGRSNVRKTQPFLCAILQLNTGVWAANELGLEVSIPYELCQPTREARQRQEGLALVKAKKKERRKKKKTRRRREKEEKKKKKKRSIPHVQWGLGLRAFSLNF